MADAIAILLAIVSAIAGAVGANTDFGTLDWRSVGIGAGITIALAILVPAILAAILSSQADKVDPSAGPTALKKPAQHRHPDLWRGMGRDRHHRRAGLAAGHAGRVGAGRDPRRTLARQAPTPGPHRGPAP